MIWLAVCGGGWDSSLLAVPPPHFRLLGGAKDCLFDWSQLFVAFFAFGSGEKKYLFACSVALLTHIKESLLPEMYVGTTFLPLASSL